MSHEDAYVQAAGPNHTALFGSVLAKGASPAEGCSSSSGFVRRSSGLAGESFLWTESCAGVSSQYLTCSRKT